MNKLRPDLSTSAQRDNWQTSPAPETPNPSVSDSASDPILLAALDPGEVVLWSSRPDPNRMKSLYAIWLFAVPWTLFSIGWTVLAAAAWIANFDSSSAPVKAFGWLMSMFGVPFVAGGVWMLNRPRHHIRAAHTMVHALTTKRLLTASEGRTRVVESVDLDKLGPITCRERPDGWGSLAVETGSRRDAAGDQVTEYFELLGIANVGTLTRQLREASQRYGQRSQIG